MSLNGYTRIVNTRILGKKQLNRLINEPKNSDIDFDDCLSGILLCRFEQLWWGKRNENSYVDIVVRNTYQGEPRYFLENTCADSMNYSIGVKNLIILGNVVSRRGMYSINKVYDTQAGVVAIADDTLIYINGASTYTLANNVDSDLSKYKIHRLTDKQDKTKNANILEIPCEGDKIKLVDCTLKQCRMEKISIPLPPEEVMERIETYKRENGFIECRETCDFAREVFNSADLEKSTHITANSQDNEPVFQ